MSIYGTLAASKTYHAARGNAAWTDGAEDEALEIALQRGTEFIDQRYSFPGNKVGGRDQERQWPRYGVVDNEGYSVNAAIVPVEVESAAYEAALRELVSPGSLTPDVTLTSQVKREKVEGAVEVEYVGASGVDAARPVITIISGILAPILTGKQTSRLSGVSTRI